MAKSALRVLEIIEYIAALRDGPTHTQISRDLRIPKSSLSALMRDLQTSGYVHLDPDSGRYSLGSQVLTLSYAYLRNLNLARVGQPILMEIFATLNEFTAFAIPKGTDYIIVAAEAPAQPLAHSLQIGERGPMFCSATGKAILAFMPEKQREQILRTSDRRALTPATKTDLPSIRKEIERTRATGVGYSREESIAGIRAIAVPVFNGARTVIGAISVALPSARLTKELEARIIASLKEGGVRFSEQLGWRTNFPARTA